jgi:hypothetical protein
MLYFHGFWGQRPWGHDTHCHNSMSLLIEYPISELIPSEDELDAESG